MHHKRSDHQWGHTHYTAYTSEKPKKSSQELYDSKGKSKTQKRFFFSFFLFCFGFRAKPLNGWLVAYDAFDSVLCDFLCYCIFGCAVCERGLLCFAVDYCYMSLSLSLSPWYSSRCRYVYDGKTYAAFLRSFEGIYQCVIRWNNQSLTSVHTFSIHNTVFPLVLRKIFFFWFISYSKTKNRIRDFDCDEFFF